MRRELLDVKNITELIEIITVIVVTLSEPLDIAIQNIDGIICNNVDTLRSMVMR